ncbi:MAG: DUF6273 domain-containing protein [Coriobacteriales bacterium]|jgi:hypothetical protein|nr:DUF6273 domain-containing protein [Coriobacteriales bacterium]
MEPYNLKTPPDPEKQNPQLATPFSPQNSGQAPYPTQQPLTQEQASTFPPPQGMPQLPVYHAFPPPQQAPPVQIGMFAHTATQILDKPFLNHWKTDSGLTVVGIFVGLFPNFFGWLANVGMPMIFGIQLVSTNRILYIALNLITVIIGSLIIIVSTIWAAGIYPSLFGVKPRVRSAARVSFFNGFFGGYIFGPIWNSNLTKRKKGISHIVCIVLNALFILSMIAALMSVGQALTNRVNTPMSENIVSPEKINLGEIIFQPYFGEEEFSENIEWIVLDVRDGDALVISKDIIELRPYNNQQTNITWAESDIREWLNGEFYEGLPVNVQRAIVEVEVKNDDNPDHGIDGGRNTTDKVFLLSFDESLEYFSADNMRRTNLNVSDDVISGAEDSYEDFWAENESDVDFDEAWPDGYDIKVLENERGGSAWWLRSPGASADYASMVAENGVVYGGGMTVNFASIGVRPVFWIKLDKIADK